jgi:hypothetical protein
MPIRVYRFSIVADIFSSCFFLKNLRSYTESSVSHLGPEEKHHEKKSDDPMEHTTQGALLLQSLLRLSLPHNRTVLARYFQNVILYFFDLSHI